VMINGRLYDAATLNEEVTGNRKRPAYWWETGQAGAGSGDSGSTHTDGHGHGDGG
jgi:hypothetical protein